MKIQSFINSMNSQLKGGSTYSIEEAIWYAEATLNYTYAIYDSSFVYSIHDTCLYTVDLDNSNNVTQSTLNDIYAAMVDSLQIKYGEITDNVKHLIYCDIAEVGSSVGHVDIAMMPVFGCGYTGILFSYFGPIDYWYSILNFGKCNGYTGQGDAADQLTLAIMNYFFQPQGMRVWFSDHVTIAEVNPWYYDYTPAPYGKRAFYYYGTGTMQYPQCLDPDDLNFYMSSNGIPYIIDDQNPDPQNLEFESINIPDDNLALGLNYWIEAHLLDITYGIKHGTNIPAIDL